MTSSADALAQLQAYQSGIKSPTQSITDASTALGVPAAQQQVQGLRGAISNTTNLLKQVAPGVMGRTQGSLVTSAQANRQIQNEQAPISDTLSKENTDYGNANQDYTDLEKQAEDRASAEQAGQQNQLSYLQDLYKNIYQSEQDSAAAAEQKREFDAQQATAARTAAAAAAGASPTFGSLGGAASVAPTKPAATMADAQSVVKAARDALGTKANWGTVANYIQSNILKGQIPTGSTIDQVLHAIYG